MVPAEEMRKKLANEGRNWVNHATQADLRQLVFNLAYRLAYVKRAVNGEELPTSLDNDDTLFEQVSDEAWLEIHNTPM